jgi:hypothetical protein
VAIQCAPKRCVPASPITCHRVVREIRSHPLPISSQSSEIVDQAIEMTLTHKRFGLGKHNPGDWIKGSFGVITTSNTPKSTYLKHDLYHVIQATKLWGKRNGQSTMSRSLSSTLFFTGIERKDTSHGSDWPAFNARSWRPRSAVDLKSNDVGQEIASWWCWARDGTPLILRLTHPSYLVIF